MVMFKVNRMQYLHSILISLTDHWSDKKKSPPALRWRFLFKIPEALSQMVFQSRIYLIWTQRSIPPASSVQSTKRWVRGMLMSVGIESSHWQVAKRLRSWASSEADCECPLYDYSLYSKKISYLIKIRYEIFFYDSDYYLINWALCLQRFSSFH